MSPAFGPTLLSKVLGLTDVQESSLGLVFHYADSKGLPLLDIADLRAVLTYPAAEASIPDEKLVAALDDVGHELRTPMTIVRGHLELMDTTDPKDAEVVRALALEELARMSNLVNDLILLAQSERSDFVVLTDVDAGRLTDETFDVIVQVVREIIDAVRPTRTASATSR